MEVVKAFNNELSSLYEGKPPISKAKMTQVTRTAIKGLKFYKHIVQSVEKFIQKCRPEYKVPGLYVIDSIVRQSRHQFGNDRDVFVPRFSKNIVLTFQHLYKCPVDERPRIVRVLNIWQKNNVFPTEIIQPLLDMANAEIPGSCLDNAQMKSKIDDWKSWNASSQGADNTQVPNKSDAGDDLEDIQARQEMQQHLSGTLTDNASGTKGGNVNLNSGLMSQLQELTSQLLNNNNSTNNNNNTARSGIPDVAQSAAPTPTKVMPPASSRETIEQDTVKFNKKLLDFDYGEEEEEEEMDEGEEKEENGHPPSTEPTALALSMAQNLLSNPELLRQLQQMQQTIQQTEAMNALSSSSQPEPSQEHQAQQPPPSHQSLEEPRLHTQQQQYKSYGGQPPPAPIHHGRVHTLTASSLHQNNTPLLYSDITLPANLPNLVSTHQQQQQPPVYPGAVSVLGPPIYPPSQQQSLLPPSNMGGMCHSPLPQQQQQHHQHSMHQQAPPPPLPQHHQGSGGRMSSLGSGPSEPPGYNNMHSGSMMGGEARGSMMSGESRRAMMGGEDLAAMMSEDDRGTMRGAEGRGGLSHEGMARSNQMMFLDRDERSLWLAKDEDERERVAAAALNISQQQEQQLQMPSQQQSRKERSRSRSRSRSPTKGSGSRSTSGRSSSRRSSRRSRSRSPRRKASRSPPNNSRYGGRDSSGRRGGGGGGGEESSALGGERGRGREEASSGRSSNKRSSSQLGEVAPSSRDPEKEKEREKERERRHRGLPALRKGFLAVCSRTLWLGHVPKISNEMEINETFAEYGPVVSVDLIPPRGCAYVVMERRQDASRALQKLRNFKLQGSLIKMAWAPGKGLKGKEYKEHWEMEQGVAFIPHEKVDPSLDLEALEEGGTLDQDSLPDSVKELSKTKESDLDSLVKEHTPGDIQAIPSMQQKQQPVQITDTEQQQAALLASAVSGAATAAAVQQQQQQQVANQMGHQGMVATSVAGGMQQQPFSMPLQGMVPQQLSLGVPQIPLPLGVPPPNPMVLVSHNSLGPHHHGNPPSIAVLNAMAAAAAVGLPPSSAALPPNPAASVMAMVEANEEMSAALATNAALMHGAFPPHLAGFSGHPFQPGGRPPQMPHHPNHMMQAQWMGASPGGPQGPFLRPPGAPGMQPFGRLMGGPPMPGSPQNVFGPIGVPNRGNIMPGFNPAMQQQQQQQQLQGNHDPEHKVSPTILEQEYNRFAATKGLNIPSPRKNFGPSAAGVESAVVPAAVGQGGNPNLEPLGSRGHDQPSPLGPMQGPLAQQQRMLGNSSNGNRAPLEMGSFRQLRPMMNFGGNRGGGPMSPAGNVGAPNRFQFSPGGMRGQPQQRPFMRGGRGGMDFRGRQGFADWGPMGGRDPFFHQQEFGDFPPMDRREWEEMEDRRMMMEQEGRFPDGPWGHPDMEERFHGGRRMEEDFGSHRAREDFGRGRDDFRHRGDDFGGPRGREDFRGREEFGRGRAGEEFGPRGPEFRNRENDLENPRSREEFGGPRDDEEAADEASRHKDSLEAGEGDALDVDNRSRKQRDSQAEREGHDFRDDRDSERGRRRDRDAERSDRNRDHDRHKDKDTDHDKDSDRDRNYDRDSERRRGRERRERTRWNRSSSREKDPSKAKHEPKADSSAPKEVVTNDTEEVSLPLDSAESHPLPSQNEATVLPEIAADDHVCTETKADEGSSALLEPVALMETNISDFPTPEFPAPVTLPLPVLDDSYAKKVNDFPNVDMFSVEALENTPEPAELRKVNHLTPENDSPKPTDASALEDGVVSTVSDIPTVVDTLGNGISAEA